MGGGHAPAALRGFASGRPRACASPVAGKSRRRRDADPPPHPRGRDPGAGAGLTVGLGRSGPASSAPIPAPSPGVTSPVSPLVVTPPRASKPQSEHRALSPALRLLPLRAAPGPEARRPASVSVCSLLSPRGRRRVAGHSGRLASCLCAARCRAACLNAETPVSYLKRCGNCATVLQSCGWERDSPHRRAACHQHRLRRMVLRTPLYLP